VNGPIWKSRGHIVTQVKGKKLKENKLKIIMKDSPDRWRQG
jgi:hypothetical protein